MSDNAKQMEQDILELLCLSDQKISDTLPLSKYGINGFDLADALIKLETKYSVKLPLRTMTTDVTFGQIKAMLIEKTTNKKEEKTVQTKKPTYEEIVTEVKKALDAFGIKSVTVDKSLKHYGIDFIDALSLMNMLEKRFLLPLNMISDAVKKSYTGKMEVHDMVFQNGFYDAYNSANFADLVHILCEHFKTEEPHALYSKVQQVQQTVAKESTNDLQK